MAVRKTIQDGISVSAGDVVRYKKSARAKAKDATVLDVQDAANGILHLSVDGEVIKNVGTDKWSPVTG